MLQYLFANNPVTTLAAPITATSASFSVVAGAGSLFPNPGTGQGFIVTLIKNGNANVYEIVEVASRSTDTFTVATGGRGYESTTALSWNAGDTVALLVTAAGLNSFLQLQTAQPELYTYSNDVGSANVYSVILTPALATLSVGQKFRFIAGHTSTGNCTFNGSPLYLPSGAQIPPGTIVAGGYYEVVYVGSTTYQLNLAFNPGAVALTETPTAPTAATTVNTTQIATTQFVKSVVNGSVTGGWNIGAQEFRFGSINNPGSNQTATFGTAFTTACTAIQLTIRGNVGVEFWCHSPPGGTPSAPTTTQFSHYANANTEMDYFAVGY